MDYKRIVMLLDKYFAGETSLEEEEALRQFFQREVIPEELKPYQPLFQFFSHERNLKPGEGFDERLLAQIESLDHHQPLRRRFWSGSVLGLAASLAIAIGFAFWLYQQPSAGLQPTAIDDRWVTVEAKTPEEAYEKTIAALKLVSSKLEKGKKKAIQNISHVDRVNKVIK